MVTHKYDFCLVGSWRAGTVKHVCCKGSLLVGTVLALFLGSPSQGWATVTPLNNSGFSNYDLMANGGDFVINSSTVGGTTGLLGSASFNSSNTDTLNAVGYTAGSLASKSGINTTRTFQDPNLAGALQSAEYFSLAMNNQLTSAQILSSGLNNLAPTQPTITTSLNNGVLQGNGGVNVIDLNGNGSNITGNLTLSGNSKDVFYINVSSNLNIQGVTLSGVNAANVYWNILNGQSSNLSGNLSGTFFVFNSSGQPSSATINNANITGAIYGGSLQLSNDTITAAPAEVDTTALVPETSSYAAMGTFAAFLVGSSVLRWWRSRRREGSALPMDAAVA